MRETGQDPPSIEEQLQHVKKLLQEQQMQMQRLADQQHEDEERKEGDDDDEEEEEGKSENEEEDDDEEKEDTEEDEIDDPLVMGTTMQEACEEGDVETIVDQLYAGKEINCVDSDYGGTPLMWILWTGNFQIAKMLLGKGADLSRVNRLGENTLHLAAAGGCCDCLKWVLSNTDIDVNSKDNFGNTPLIRACINSELGTASLLVGKGGRLLLENGDGLSAMNSRLGDQLLQHAKELGLDPEGEGGEGKEDRK
jgi:hypothetical protein